ncbi:hypothetical protein AB0K18_24325 [Nonomuraea sp. NPDC049421]|uniref:hypothetical protein n=1 Tax=Nonomuraea sp. NPDC049421 TaxID=3155275 RepID=UPI00342091A4
MVDPRLLHGVQAVVAGDGGTGGTVGSGVKDSVPWWIGNVAGMAPVARPYAQATAAIEAATASSPAPPGWSEVSGMMMTRTSGGVFHWRV